MGSPLPISYRDIVAWQTVTGAQPDPWELQAIYRLDSAWFEAQPKPEKRGGG